MALRKVTLADKYDLAQSRLFATGFQALVRMCLMQKERDRRAGLNTAGYITGYRGSPLGGLDYQFQRAESVLKPNDILFQGGLNEDLAATALWGSQQAELRGEGKFDGVFGLWYGKGPGVDRSGDVLRHANFAGSSRHGGVLALMGDDHTAESSTTAHQSEFNFVDMMIPILNPAGVQEIIDYGIYGWAMSRFCGTWVGLKCMHETVESTAVIEGHPERIEIAAPTDFIMPPGGLNIRLHDTILGQEARLHDYKRDAMLAFLRANRLNRIITSGGPNAKIGVITTGKAYLDVRQALDDLGIDEVKANDFGLRVHKIACPWPIARQELADFARGLDLIIVVEEKRSLIEVQVREELYGTANQPVCIGKKDEQGNWLFPAKGALDPNDVAVCIGDRLLKYVKNDELSARVARLKEAQRILVETQDVAVRSPYFCSGCPHNSSTVVPEGMRAYAGIGCHFMVQWMDRSTLGFTHMGGEGANWIGEAPFSNRAHVFQNLGDGTYNHSGYMAIRAAIAAGVNITYKILFNDAVAMTGGQKNEGDLTVPQIARQVAAEGAKKIVVVSDEPKKYPSGTEWPAGITFHHRDDLDSVQRDLAAIEGCTILIYDQTCAAEKRRRRKRGQFPDPDKRVIINELVCEGCGDCGVQSNCVSVQPLETEFGRKRTIDQSSCNKDFSCVKGFCPSFVTVEGATLKKGQAMSHPADFVLPEPPPSEIGQTYNIIVTGVGGTGIVTIGAIIGMAAHLEGKGAGVLDMAGLAQKGGAVQSHIRIARNPDDIHAIRVAAREADLVLGGDIVVTGNKKILSAARSGRTRMVINTAEVLPGEFTRDTEFSLPFERLKRALLTAAGADRTSFIDATRLATGLLGQSIGANMFMLGYAYQLGALPLSAESIERALELNGEAVAMNVAAFRWGRRAAVDPSAVEAAIAPTPEAADAARKLSQSFDEVVSRRIDYLTAYQNAAYAARYKKLVDEAVAAEGTKAPGKCGLGEAVARYLFKLMAYKDEYEVARLYSDGAFARQVASELGGNSLRFNVHLSPPLLARRDPHTGVPRKMTFGPWIFPAFALLAKLKGLRGTAFDVFGYTQERQTERRLVRDYEAMVSEIFSGLTTDNHHLAVGLAAIPEKIRGFGHIKTRNLATAKAEETALLEQFRAHLPPMLKAAE
jgi:indolepyruvate ferredoxin oxidoreductase